MLIRLRTFAQEKSLTRIVAALPFTGFVKSTAQYISWKPLPALPGNHDLVAALAPSLPTLSPPCIFMLDVRTMSTGANASDINSDAINSSDRGARVRPPAQVLGMSGQGSRRGAEHTSKAGSLKEDDTKQPQGGTAQRPPPTPPNPDNKLARSLVLSIIDTTAMTIAGDELRQRLSTMSSNEHMAVLHHLRHFVKTNCRRPLKSPDDDPWVQNPHTPGLRPLIHTRAAHATGVLLAPGLARAATNPATPVSSLLSTIHDLALLQEYTGVLVPAWGFARPPRTLTGPAAGSPAGRPASTQPLAPRDQPAAVMGVVQALMAAVSVRGIEVREEVLKRAEVGPTLMRDAVVLKANHPVCRPLWDLLLALLPEMTEVAYRAPPHRVRSGNLRLLSDAEGMRLLEHARGAGVATEFACACLEPGALQGAAKLDAPPYAHLVRVWSASGAQPELAREWLAVAPATASNLCRSAQQLQALTKPLTVQPQHRDERGNGDTVARDDKDKGKSKGRSAHSGHCWFDRSSAYGLFNSMVFSEIPAAVDVLKVVCGMQVGDGREHYRVMERMHAAAKLSAALGDAVHTVSLHALTSEMVQSCLHKSSQILELMARLTWPCTGAIRQQMQERGRHTEQPSTPSAVVCGMRIKDTDARWDMDRAGESSNQADGACWGRASGGSGVDGLACEEWAHAARQVQGAAVLLLMKEDTSVGTLVKAEQAARCVSGVIAAGQPVVHSMVYAFMHNSAAALAEVCMGRPGQAGARARARFPARSAGRCTSLDSGDARFRRQVMEEMLAEGEAGEEALWSVGADTGRGDGLAAPPPNHKFATGSSTQLQTAAKLMLEAAALLAKRGQGMPSIVSLTADKRTASAPPKPAGDDSPSAVVFYSLLPLVVPPLYLVSAPVPLQLAIASALCKFVDHSKGVEQRQQHRDVKKVRGAGGGGVEAEEWAAWSDGARWQGVLVHGSVVGQIREMLRNHTHLSSSWSNAAQVLMQQAARMAGLGNASMRGV